MSTDNAFTLGMGFVPPMSVTLANLTTNVPASALLPWNPATNYALNAEICDPATGVIWRSMLAGNQGNDPLTTSGKWQNRGVENRLRMFDASLGSATENPELIEVVIPPGRVVTDVILLGVQAHDVQVLMNDPVEGLVFDSEDILMLRPSGNSHWGYYFEPITRQRRLHVWGLPAYTQATVTIRIRNPGSIAKCAEAVIGRAVWLGNTQWRPSIGFDDWGVKKRDEWGGWTVDADAGAFSDRMKLQVLVEEAAYERTRERILPYRHKHVVWIGARGVNALTLYGYITGFEQVIPGVDISDCQMTFEGLESNDLY